MFFLLMFCWLGKAAGHEAVSVLEQREHVGQWYAWNDNGTYVVSGNRVVFFEGVQVPEELAFRLINLIIGAGWKESYLLFHEFLGRAAHNYIPDSANILLRGVSQAWLIWTVYRSIADISGPLLSMINEYRQAWSLRVLSSPSSGQEDEGVPAKRVSGGKWTGQRYKGNVPIPVNDVELSFRVFVRAVFPEGLDDPVAVEIDRIPAMPGLPQIVKPHIHANPWDKLVSEMAAEEISRVRIAGSSRGRLQLTYQDSRSNWRGQLITASMDAEYEPVPWLLDMVRQGVSREDTRLYASLLSHDVLELASQMLSCRRLNPAIALDKPAFCTLGQMEAKESNLHYRPYELLVPPQIWEDRNYPKGRVLPLSGCNFSDRSLCWENYLIWSDSTLVYPWPVLTLYSRFSGYEERTGWLLLSKEPQKWHTVSNFQIRVPELVTKMMLNLVSTIGQVAVNRLVTSLHHGWWGNGKVMKHQGAKPQSTHIPEDEGHADPFSGQEDEFGQGRKPLPCPVCETTCRYPLCNICQERYEEDTMVTVCDRNHKYCADCFYNLLDRVGVKNCDYCGQIHRNLLNPVFYPTYDPNDVNDKPKYLVCPDCRDRVDFNKGNVNQFLQDECGTVRKWLKWMFSDGLKIHGAGERNPMSIPETRQEPEVFNIAD